MMEPEPCPKCGSRDIWPEFEGSPYGMFCNRCDYVGPRVAVESYPDTAIQAWNRDAAKIAEARRLGLTVRFDDPAPPPTPASQQLDMFG